MCWEPGAPEWGRRLVHDTIARTWAAHGDLDFVGWQECNLRSTGIRIAAADRRPRALGLGRHLDGKVGGVTVNFWFEEWEGCAVDPRACISADAIHEFGHALGFDHEHLRFDTPGTCQSDEDRAYVGDVPFGVWDADSVMNYCNPHGAPVTELSAGDIAGLQAVYGHPDRNPACR